MTGVIIDSGKPGEYGSYYDYPPERWPELAEVRKNYIDHKLTFDCRFALVHTLQRLVKWVKEAEEMAPVLGYASGREMVEQYYQLDPEEIAIAIRWLELNDPEAVIGIEAVQALAKQSDSTDRDEKGRTVTLPVDAEVWASKARELFTTTELARLRRALEPNQ